MDVTCDLLVMLFVLCVLLVCIVLCCLCLSRVLCVVYVVVAVLRSSFST